MSGDTPSTEEILAAVRGSGYLMEQEVASNFERMGFHVQTARAFQDVDEGKSREIDAWAIHRFFHDADRKLAGYSEIIAECKNSKNPFVFITRPKGAVDERWEPPTMRFPITAYEGRKELGGGRAQLQIHRAFRELGFQEAHHFHKRATKAVQFCRIDRDKSKWAANHNGLYDAIFYPILKALKARQKESEPRQGVDEYRYAWFFYPVVVVRGKIFEIDSSSSDKTPVEVSHVPFVRELKSKHLEGRFSVDFVNEDHLSDFVENVVRDNERRMIALFKGSDELLTKERPWRNAQD